MTELTGELYDHITESLTGEQFILDGSPNYEGFWTDWFDSTEIEKAIEKTRESLDAQRYAYIRVYNQKEEDNMPTVGMSASEPREMWSIYHVIAIEKENCGEGIPKIDTKVVAKNAEHAKGLAGVNTMLERNNFDNTKITVICDRLATVKPVKDDE